MKHLKAIFTYLKGIPEDIINIYHCGVTMQEAYSIRDADDNQIHEAFFEFLAELIHLNGLTPGSKNQLDTRPRFFEFSADSLSDGVLELWSRWKPTDYTWTDEDGKQHSVPYDSVQAITNEYK